MSRKKWALLILCILLLAGYFKLFFKTFTETAVPKSADCIIAVDVKRIANTMIWNTIITPSQWKKISFSSSGGVNWKDMFSIPDYIFIFHSAGQPFNAWYSVFEIKDKDDFNKGLLKYHFIKTNGTNILQQYASADYGLAMMQSGNKVMIANMAVQNDYLLQAADELFIKKQYSTKEILRKNTETSSHVSMQINDKEHLENTAIIQANFDRQKISIDGYFDPKQSFDLSENNFSYAGNSLLTLGFIQPPASLYKLIPDSTKMAISKLINTDIDSLLLENNHYYSLDIEGIHTRDDTAISYTYDADFTPVESKVVNNVQEPAFNFTINGEHTNAVYDYWKNNGKLEETATGNLFTPIPFVRSYCKKINEKELAVISNNYLASPKDASFAGILFFNCMTDKIPASLKKYFPVFLQNFSGNLHSILITAKQENKRIAFHCIFTKQKNDKPIIEW